jgi:hypothetical protein
MIPSPIRAARFFLVVLLLIVPLSLLALQLSFNPSLKVDFQGSRVTSDGGLLLVRELDERLGLAAGI